MQLAFLQQQGAGNNNNIKESESKHHLNNNNMNTFLPPPTSASPDHDGKLQGANLSNNAAMAALAAGGFLPSPGALPHQVSPTHITCVIANETYQIINT